ncbi:MAG: ATP-dependent helicase, partial [Solirubrobacterales bacterium]
MPTDGLTPAQRQAVTHAGGPLLVLGGPGTGKTLTLIARFQWLVEQGAPPESVLALTVSAPAADALRIRIEDAIDRPYEELSVCTVHGLCARLLRDEAAEAGLDPFAQPVTPADRLAMLLDRIDELTLRRHDLRGNPAALLAGVIERIDRLKEELVTAEEYAAWAAEASRSGQEREFAGLYRAHDRMLRERGALDFGDLLLTGHRLLRDNAGVLARAAERQAHLLVDEYQDLNLAQVQIVGLLARGSATAVLAADPEQSILRFRGAATKNVEALDAPVVRLERSFRCRRRILDAAGAEVDGEPGGEVAFWRATHERAQAQAVAADIERRIVREGLRPDEVAVLVRSVRNEGQEVAVALEERAVPFRLVGAAAFFQRAEIRDVLAWLRLLSDPGDAGAVVRA